MIKVLFCPVFQSFDDIARAPGSKTSFEVSIVAADSRKKVHLLLSQNLSSYSFWQKLVLLVYLVEQMTDSSGKGKQTKSANTKSANSLQIAEPVESKPDGEVIFYMLNP